jgi:hypothetical protein
MLVNVKGCTVTVEKSVDRVGLGAMVLVAVRVRWTVNSADSVAVTVENTTPQDEQVEGQTPCGVDVSLAALAALAVTTALVELSALVAGLAAVAVAVSGIESGVVVTLLCPAASVYTTVDVEVEFKVT